jgi:3-oxoacyl-[acyl-carrier-protein] synthase-3
MLVIGGERLTRLVNWADRNTCVIFADGAGAVLLGEGDTYLSSKLNTKGGDNVIHIPIYDPPTPFSQHESLPPYIRMNGQETFKFAVNAMVTDLTEVINAAGLKQSDIAWVIPHQANARILDAAARKLDIPEERFCKNIDKYGNTSSATIPMLLDEMNRDGRLKNGDYLAMAAFGGGLSSAACVIRWES